MINHYSLDASTCIDVIRNQEPKVRSRFERVAAAGHQIAISTIALHELWYGAAKSGNPRHIQALRVFLTGVQILDFDSDDALVTGQVRADLSSKGATIGPFDTLIASQALRRKYIAVTSNVKEFSRVTGLMIENWRE